MLKEELDITSKQAYDICRMLIQKGCVEIIRTLRPMHYRYTGLPTVSADSSKETVAQMSQDIHSEQCDELMMRLDEMSGECATDRDKRIACFLRKKVDENQMVFYRDEFMKSIPLSRSVVTGDLRYAANLGLIERSPQRMEGTCYYEYRIWCIMYFNHNSKNETTSSVFLYFIYIVNQFTVNLHYVINEHSFACRPAVFCKKHNLAVNGVDLSYHTSEVMIFAAFFARIWHEKYKRYYRVMTILYHIIDQRQFLIKQDFFAFGKFDLPIGHPAGFRNDAFKTGERGKG